MPASSADRGRLVHPLELFYDLVFVVGVQQLARRLETQGDLAIYLVNSALAALIWFCWLNQTLLMNQVSARGGRETALVLTSMSGVGVIAVSLSHDAEWVPFTFAAGYALARVALWPIWRSISTNFPRPSWRERWITPTLFGPGLAAAWLASALLPAPAIYVAWGALLLTEAVVLVQGLPSAAYRGDHLVERAELFVLILLGDSVIEVVLTITVDSSTLAWIVAGIAFLGTCAIWAIYFELGVAVPALRRYSKRTTGGFVRDVVVTAHLALLLGLVLIAAGFRSAIETADNDVAPPPAVGGLGGGLALLLVAQCGMAIRCGFDWRWTTLWGAPALGIAVAILLWGQAWPTLAVACLASTSVGIFLALGYALVRSGRISRAGLVVRSHQRRPARS